jgi:hypothetical protein
MPGGVATEGHGSVMLPCPPYAGMTPTQGPTGKPDVPRCRSGAAASGWVASDNRHLNHLAESIP